MKRLKSIRGVELYETTDGVTMVHIRYQCAGKQYTECVGPSERVKGRDKTIARARRLLEQRRAEIRQARLRRETWLSPRERQRIESEKAAEVLSTRGELVFEAVVERYLDAYGSAYSRPREVRYVFERSLAKAFGGMHLDTITRGQVRQYFQDRLENAGPFAGHGRKVGLRTPKKEIDKLSALFSFLIDEEERRGLDNPCTHTRSRRKGAKKSEVYRPLRQPVTATPAECAVLFDSVPVGDSRRGSEHRGLQYRALFKLARYTGGRPESDLQGLTHGDFEIPPHLSLVGDRPSLGRVAFRRAKTSQGDRVLPLHPEVVADLRAILDPRPADEALLEEWKQRPVFRRKGSAEPMDRHSYAKAWGATKSKAAASLALDSRERSAEVARMWVRDFRGMFRTELTNARVPEPAIRYLMGHTRDVSQRYYHPPWGELEKAILALGVGASAVDRDRGPGRSDAALGASDIA